MYPIVVRDLFSIRWAGMVEENMKRMASVAKAIGNPYGFL
jgi:hypothetical protein